MTQFNGISKTRVEQAFTSDICFVFDSPYSSISVVLHPGFTMSPGTSKEMRNLSNSLSNSRYSFVKADSALCMKITLAQFIFYFNSDVGFIDFFLDHSATLPTVPEFISRFPKRFNRVPEQDKVLYIHPLFTVAAYPEIAKKLFNTNNVQGLARVGTIYATEVLFQSEVASEFSNALIHHFRPQLILAEIMQAYSRLAEWEPILEAHAFLGDVNIVRGVLLKLAESSAEGRLDVVASLFWKSPNSTTKKLYKMMVNSIIPKDILLEGHIPNYALEKRHFDKVKFLLSRRGVAEHYNALVSMGKAIHDRDAMMVRLFLESGVKPATVDQDGFVHVYMWKEQDIEAAIRFFFGIIEDLALDLFESERTDNESVIDQGDEVVARSGAAAAAASYDPDGAEEILPDDTLVPCSSKVSISQLIQLRQLLSTQLTKSGIETDVLESVNSLIMESYTVEETSFDTFVSRKIKELVDLYPEFNLLMVEMGHALGITVHDPLAILMSLISSKNLLRKYFQYIKQHKQTQAVVELSDWSLGHKTVTAEEVYCVRSNSIKNLYFYITPELISEYPALLTSEKLSNLKMISRDSRSVDGIKHLGGIIELKILDAGDDRFVLQRIYRKPNGDLLIVFDAVMNHDEVAAHVGDTTVQTVDCVTGAAQPADDAEAVAGDTSTTLPMATVADFDTNAAILGIPVVHGDIVGEGLVVIDSDSEQGRVYPAGARVVYKAIQDGTPSCSDNALFTAMKLIALGKSPFLLKTGDHVVVAVHSEEDIDEVLGQLDSVDLQDYPELWEQYLEVMTGCTSGDVLESVLSDFSTFSWLQGEISIVKNAVSSWGSNTLTAYVNNILATLSELDFTSPEMHEYASQVQAMLTSLLDNIGTHIWCIASTRSWSWV